MREVMAPQESTEDGNDKLPVDFFDLEFLSNKPDPRQRDRDLPDVEVESAPGELPVDFFDLEFISTTPDPRQRDRGLPETGTNTE